MPLPEIEELLQEIEMQETREKFEKRRAIKNTLYAGLAKEAGGSPDSGCVRACCFVGFRPSLVLKMFRTYEVAKAWIREGRDLGEGGVFWGLKQESATFAM